jgi:predicted transcriptional regulator
MYISVMAKNEKSPKPTTRSVVLDPETDAKLAKLAESEDRSISYMIAKAVKEMIERKAAKSGD